MRYLDVCIDALGYELAPNVVSTRDLEKRLLPLYKELHLQTGQLEALTGIRERRFWDQGVCMADAATLAGQKALAKGSVLPGDIGMLIYAGVCRDNLEPATACKVAYQLDISPNAAIFDLSNACLGVLNGMLQVANAIALGQIKAGLVVSTESSRQIVESTIQRMLAKGDMETFKECIATLTGGSGAVAVLLTHENYSSKGHRLLGGVMRNATVHHGLCTWGPDSGIPAGMPLVMRTDSVGVLKHGVALGIETFADFKQTLELAAHEPDKIICHQVGATHQKTILDSLKIDVKKDFVTYPYLGNIGTVSLPITAAIAEERGFLKVGDLVGFFGIGSGLNCMMLGVRW
ncbi:MAG: 3-oxoacyl-ACP synthase III [Desulfobacteraceae bacterium]